MELLKKIFAKKRSMVFTVEIGDGLHLRPCAKISSIANSFDSTIKIIYLEKTKNVKNMNEILSLGLVCGDEIEIEAVGSDASEAILTIKSTFDELSQEKSLETKDEDDIQNNNEEIFYDGVLISGIKISNGVGIGVVYTPYEGSSGGDKMDFTDAVRLLNEELSELSGDDTNSQKDIFLAQSCILNNLPNKSFELFESAIDGEISTIVGTQNESKIADYKDIKNRVIQKMNGISGSQFPDYDFILVSAELLPSDITKLLRTNIKGVVVQEISPRSHVALLLRSYGIPSLKIEDISSLSGVKNQIILDANSQVLITTPALRDIDKAKQNIKLSSDLLVSQNTKKLEPAITKNGKRIRVLANITDYDSALEAKEAGCEGIGLLRSEFLFQSIKPTREIQQYEYEKIFMLFDDVTVRTLDVGGDKKLPYMSLPHEDNPFLGIRGVRLFKTHIEIMQEQLYAILMAKKAGKLKIMFPMVATVDEFVYAKSIALEIAKDSSIDLTQVSFGIMVEVPSVLFLIGEFDKVVDFYSIGTNDLSQYLFAIDRTHTQLEIDSHSSVLFDAIKLLRDNSTRPISICGELASDLEATSRLIEIGIDTLSVPATTIPTLKARIRDV